jgi:phosphate uptake regulator
MDFRRVQETGGTFLVSLPREWAKRGGFTKGSILAVIERQDGCLIIDPKYKFEKNVEVATITASPYIEREITGKYLLGFDILKIEGQNRLSPGISERVRQMVRHLIGLEIVEEDAHMITLQCLLDPSSFPPEKILRRELLFASSMHKDALTAFLEEDIPLAKGVVERDEEVDRLYFLIVRLLRTAILNPGLSEKMSLSTIDCLDYRLAASYIESIGDYSCETARNIIEYSETRLPKDLLQPICRLGELSYEMHQNAIQAFFSKSLDPIGKVSEASLATRDIVKELSELFSKEPSRVISYASSVVSSLNRICGYSSDLADLVLPR